MEVKKVVVGSLQTNCYLLINDDKCLIIDPGDEAEKIKEEISNKTVVGILITHHHFDHVGALNNLKEFYQTKVYDYHNLEEINYNIENFSFEVIYTLGHTDDSVTYYFKDYNIMFVGDFIFKGSIGRTDLPTGDINNMEESLNKIKNYHDNIKIFPGHGDETTLGYERDNNYFLIGK